MKNFGAKLCFANFYFPISAFSFIIFNSSFPFSLPKAMKKGSPFAGKPFIVLCFAQATQQHLTLSSRSYGDGGELRRKLSLSLSFTTAKI
jgi:hypothetical protein